jgi:outer membrane lipoprotein-sorting protein
MKNSFFRICFTFLVCLTGFVTCAIAQDSYRPATREEIADIQKKIETASAALKTLHCDFEQTKTLSILAEEILSTGFMTYQQPDVVHWEYVKPYHYVFAMNGNKVIIESGGHKDEIDVNSSKLFKEISAIIVSGINGHGIFDETRFSAKFMAGKSSFLIILTPKQKAIRQMFQEIQLLFDAGDYTVNIVTIKETGGDQTVIRMKNKKIGRI